MSIRKHRLDTYINPQILNKQTKQNRTLWPGTQCSRQLEGERQVIRLSNWFSRHSHTCSKVYWNRSKKKSWIVSLKVRDDDQTKLYTSVFPLDSGLCYTIYWFSWKCIIRVFVTLLVLLHDPFLLSSDINECDINNGGCSHNCFNFAGSYYCQCPTGYRLLDDTKTCVGKRKQVLFLHLGYTNWVDKTNDPMDALGNLLL